jgi:ATP sulfurylase
MTFEEKFSGLSSAARSADYNEKLSAEYKAKADQSRAELAELQKAVTADIAHLEPGEVAHDYLHVWSKRPDGEVVVWKMIGMKELQQRIEAANPPAPEPDDADAVPVPSDEVLVEADF